MLDVRTPVLRAALLLTAALAACLAVAAVDLPGRPQTLCLLRAATGVPCPLCGATTAAVAVGQGRLGAALAANPLVVLAGGVAVALPVLPAAVRRRLAASAAVAVPLALVLGELWQLGRLP